MFTRFTWRKFWVSLALLRTTLPTALAGSALICGCDSSSNDANVTRSDPTVIAEGRQWVGKFYEGHTETLWDQFTPGMQSFMKSKQDLDDFRNVFDGHLGTEWQVIEERVERLRQFAIYVRSATFQYSGTRQAIRVGFDESSKIALFSYGPAEPAKEAPTSHLDYVTRTSLRLPFDGQWYVLSGGRKIAENRHAAMRDQRFAYDFLMQENDKSYRTTGQENADYLCFGQPLLAPGAGTIVGVREGIEDNPPGVSNEFGLRMLGNHVIIDHGQSEFSFLGHLKNGSTRVQVGDRVDAGTLVGLCGNSGLSTEPHLHYHLQNTPVLAHGDGLPAQFRSYTANGRFVESGEPTRQERVINGRDSTERR